MSDKIYVSETIAAKTPQILRDLKDGTYRLKKIKYRENPIHGKGMEDSFERTGDLAIIDRGGMPALRVVGNGFYDGVTTSGIVEASQAGGHIDILTENSHYELFGPLPEGT